MAHERPDNACFHVVFFRAFPLFLILVTTLYQISSKVMGKGKSFHDIKFFFFGPLFYL